MNTMTLAEYRDMPKKREKQKYSNEKITLPNGEKFDSKAEYRRWVFLDAEQKAKRIKDLKRQVPYELIPAQVTPEGLKVRPMHYVADFTYTDKSGNFVVEDPKGATTAEFKIKQKLMLKVHGIWIREIRS